MEQQEYRALFFDADDTIFDYQKGEHEAFRSTADAFGFGDRLDEAHELYRGHNSDVWSALEEGRITQDELKIERFRRMLHDLVADEDRAPAMSAFYIDRLAEQTHLLPGAEQLLRDAADRYLLVLVTNGLTTVQRRRFAAAPVTRHFRKILISEEVGTAKPDPAIFSEAFEDYGLVPREVLLIGDSSSSDMGAAHNAGMDFCWLNPAGGEAPDGYNPRYVISRLDEIRPILGLED